MIRLRHAIVLLAFLPLACTHSSPPPASPPTPTSPFAIRGLKGLWWEGFPNYRKALPFAASHDLNFLMFCYSSFPASGHDWRSDYTPAELTGFRELSAEANRDHIELCLSFNPGIWSNPPLTYSDEHDYQLAWHKIQSVHATGIHSFALCLDDINTQLQPADATRFKDLAHCQSYFVNRLYTDLHQLDPTAHFIFCPSAYTTEEADKHADYSHIIGDSLNPSIDLFWTGPVVCSPTITSSDADHMTALYRRKVIVWDNYPVNDMFPWRPLLAPVQGRSPDLATHIKGIMANPMKQWDLSAIPLATLADYLHDPVHYNAQISLTHTIDAYPADQRRTLRLLCDVYGSSFLGQPGYPPSSSVPKSDAAAHLTQLQQLQSALSTDSSLADIYTQVKPTLDSDIATTSRLARDRKKDSPLAADGDDFQGGAADLYGPEKFGRHVNYIYAIPTHRDSMSVEFDLPLTQPPHKPATLTLTARNDDSGHPPHIRIILNNRILLDTTSPFTTDFTTQSITIPPATLHPGPNHLVIRNMQHDGTPGMPPWFMVSHATLIPPN